MPLNREKKGVRNRIADSVPDTFSFSSDRNSRVRFIRSVDPHPRVLQAAAMTGPFVELHRRRAGKGTTGTPILLGGMDASRHGSRYFRRRRVDVDRVEKDELRRQVKPIIAAVLLATCLLIILTFLAKRVALDYHLSNLVGRLDNPYGFQNLALPRILRFIMTSIPAGLGAIAIYAWSRRGTPYVSLWTKLVAIALIAIPIGLMMGDSTESVNRPFRATLAAVYMLALSIILPWITVRRDLRAK